MCGGDIEGHEPPAMKYMTRRYARATPSRACMTQSKSHMDFCDLDSGFLDLDSGPESQETAVNVQDGVFWILDSDFLDLDLGSQNARLNSQTWIWILRSGL